jgi:multidrug efflux system membrane fusion protein
MLLAGCKGGEEGPAPKPSPADAGEVAISVDVAVARRGQIARAASTTGVVQAAKQASLRAETGGRVAKVEVEDGQLVNEGALLLRIDDTRQTIAVAGAKAQLAAMKEDLAFAEKELERKRRLAEKGSIASAALDAAEYQKAKAEAGVASADANLRSARRSLADTRVVAPFEGIASSVMVDLGDTTAPGAPLLELFDLSQIELRVGLAGDELAGLEVGSKATIRVEDLGGLEREGSIASIAPSASPVTGLFEVAVQADNADGQVRAGMVASVRLVGGQKAPALLVPRECVTRRGGHMVVFSVEEGRARMHRVRVGASDRDSIELLEGVDEGMTLARSALHALAEGVAIEANERPVATAAAAAPTGTAK